jgi:hypothetical protein
MAEKTVVHPQQQEDIIITATRRITMAMVAKDVSQQWKVQFQHFKALNISAFNEDIKNFIFGGRTTFLPASPIELISAAPVI